MGKMKRKRRTYKIMKNDEPRKQHDDEKKREQ